MHNDTEYIPSNLQKDFKALLDKTPTEWDKIIEEEAYIDKFNLHEEVATQAQSFYKWSKLSKQARTLKKKIEEYYNRVKYRTELSIRKNPTKYGIIPDSKGQIKEGAVKAKVNIDKSVINAQSAFHLAYAYRLTFMDAVATFNQRSYLISEEVDLWRDEYYIDNRLEKTTEDFRNKISKKRKKLC